MRLSIDLSLYYFTQINSTVYITLNENENWVSGYQVKACGMWHEWSRFKNEFIKEKECYLLFGLHYLENMWCRLSNLPEEPRTT